MGLEDHRGDFEAITSALLRAAASPGANRQSASMQAVAKPLFLFLFFLHADNMGLSGEKTAPFIIRNSPFNYKSHLVHSSLL